MSDDHHNWHRVGDLHQFPIAQGRLLPSDALTSRTKGATDSKGRQAGRMVGYINLGPG